MYPNPNPNWLYKYNNFNLYVPIKSSSYVLPGIYYCIVILYFIALHYFMAFIMFYSP